MVADIAYLQQTQQQISQLDTLLDRQRQAYRANPMPEAGQRIQWLKSLANLLVTEQKAIIEAINRDFSNRSADETLLAEVLPSLHGVHYAAKRVKKWMKPSRRSVGMQFMPASAKVIYQPLGVVGVIVPWNYPLFLAIGPLTGALAAGNRVMIKMSESTPASAQMLKDLLGKIFPEDLVAVVQGEVDVGVAFSKLPFDHLLFTGATSIGRHVMRAAAENLVPVTLELGGKSPTIISRSADFQAAVHKIIAGKLHNAGQICLAPDYVFVPEESLDDFIASAREAIARFYPSLRDNPDYTSVINARHQQRLQGYLDEAREAGVELIELNPAGEDFAAQAGHKLAPTLLRNPGDELKVMQDEIFGPLLPLKPYKTIGEVIAYINAHPRPLGLYYFGSDADEQALVLRRTTSGGVTINDVIKHVGVESLPFGGVGPSGIGAYHGRDGFRTFSHAKAVFKPADGPDLMRPPYVEPVRQAVAALITR